MQTAPIVKDVVLIGGGHAHVQVIKSFGMRPIPGVRLTVISRDIETPYSGMLPGLLAGFYTFEETHIDLRPLARFANARLLPDTVFGLDLEGRRVLMRDHPALAYDVLSIDIGSTPSANDVPGAAEHAIPVKPITGLADRWAAILEKVRAGSASKSGPRRFMTVGAGAAGIEVTLAVRHRLRQVLEKELGRDPDELSFTILARGDLLPGHNASARRRMQRTLDIQGVKLITNLAVTGIERGEVRAAGGRTFACDEVFWVTQAGAAGWLAQTGLALDDRGFIRVDDCLRSVSHPEVFAAGDIAAMTGRPLAKAGVFAVRQGPPLTENLRRATDGQPLVPYVPQRDFLCLISTGDRSAIATRGIWSAEGPLIWRWKDWIDRRFMQAFQALPPMPGASPDRSPDGSTKSSHSLQDADVMRCGGCGAKVGKDVLSRVLTRLAPRGAPHLTVGLESPDDAAILIPPPGKLLVQTVDFFRAFIDDPYVFGRIAANHALGDIYAMGGTPLTALAIATVPHGAEAKVEEDLYQILRGGLDVLEAAGCVLSGGHSAEGAELALGFTINGAVDADRILRKGGAGVGDALILTKPLGTGALLAAEMRGKARAPWMAAALECMQASNAAAARILLDHAATACTDVTGFGLAGHLHEMLTASYTDARIELKALPTLPGVTDMLAHGIASSLAPDNQRLARAISAPESAAGDPRFALLFDPQTAGGLLASVPAGLAEACIATLRTAGYASAVAIGTVAVRLGDQPEITVSL